MSSSIPEIWSPAVWPLDPAAIAEIEGWIHGTHLTMVLDNTDMRGSVLDGIEMRDESYFIDANFEGAYLRNSDFYRCHFNRSILSGVDFTAALLRKATFDDAAAPRAIFREALLADAEFWRTDLQDANFTEAELYAVSFDMSLIQGATFTGAKARMTKFGMVDDSNDFTGMTGTVLGCIRIHRDGDIIELSYSATENWFAERGAEISVVPPAGPLPTRARSTKGQD